MQKAAMAMTQRLGEEEVLIEELLMDDSSLIIPQD